ncbi:hypothetical protein PR202_ga08040 [Eleusine coracana subsp. coracana]|uniref:Gnk2-homologous domain-containing protein n=1 Tax=Eleusine coracana subsp. coracana TaxID=191504 RepID=A0AAV5C0A4_ELECO|nr:hypothetical protein PR202_ga08040 [Eleusine coracana subsp. coracana]
MAMVTVVLGALLLLLGSGGLAPFRASADVFCDNLKLVATALPRNISTSPVHFATTAFGQAPDVVYALALCRGDVVNGTACGECVASTFQRILNWTPPPDPPAQCYRAFYYYADPCPVFYTTEDIITPTNDTAASPFVKWNEKNVTGDVDLVVGLTQKLLVETVDRAATATPGRFATGVMDSGTAYPLVYSMAQCTPDLSAGDCSVCLRRLLGMVNSTMVLRMGAQIHVVHCYFRYEAYQFYDSQPMLSLGPASAPALTPAMEKNKRHFSKLWAIPIVLFPLAAGACLCFVLYSRQKKMQRKVATWLLNMLPRAWQLWNEERWNELVDSSLLPKDHSEEMVKCINIALLCVQENAADRPTMSDVIAMLSSEPIILAEPKKPAHFNVRVGNEEESVVTESYSVNDMSISVTIGR